jgi:hypothetical protein
MRRVQLTTGDNRQIPRLLRRYWAITKQGRVGYLSLWRNMDGPQQRFMAPRRPLWSGSTRPSCCLAPGTITGPGSRDSERLTS